MGTPRWLAVAPHLRRSLPPTSPAPAAPAGGRSRDFTNPLRGFESQGPTLRGILRWLRRSFHPFPPPGLRHNQLPITGIMVQCRRRGGGKVQGRPAATCLTWMAPSVAAAPLALALRPCPPSALSPACAPPDLGPITPDPPRRRPATA